MHHTHRACYALLLLLLLAQLAATTVAYLDPRAGQLSPSVLLVGEWDWQESTGSDGKPWSRCLDMVWRARSVVSGNRLNFVPTHQWLPREDGFGVSQLCYLHSDSGGDLGKCLSWTPGKIAEFKKSMTNCFAETFRQGYIPYVRPHLDDGLHRGIWRNALMFNPLEKYNGYSYKDVMIDPLAEALRDAIRITAAEGTLYYPPDKQRPVVYVSLQGEMSATVMRYTSAWASLISAIKGTIGSQYADVKVGIGLNFNALDDTENHKVMNSGIFGFLWGSGQRASRVAMPAIDGNAVSNLISNQIDFVGISAYAPYSGNGFGPNEFENSAFMVGDSLKRLANGVCLSCLVNSGKLELHYSEFGVGGGHEGNQQIASSAHMAAREPWAGLAGSYEVGKDPWRRSDLNDFRNSFYFKALDWLSRPNARTYQVGEVFVWGMSTWDVFGIYPETSSPYGTYRGNGIVGAVSKHNIEVVASKVYALKGSAAAEAARAEVATGKPDNGQRAPSSGPAAAAAPAAPPAAPAPAAAKPAKPEWQPKEKPVPPPAPAPTRAPAPTPAPTPASAPRPAPRRADRSQSQGGFLSFVSAVLG